MHQKLVFNALKCVENNPFFMFNTQRAIRGLFIHLLLSMFLTELPKKETFLQVYFFTFYLPLKTRAFILSYFLWTQEVAMDRPLSTSGSELKKCIRQWQYNWTRCVIYLPRLVVLLEFVYGSKLPLCRHRSRCFLVSFRSYDRLAGSLSSPISVAYAIT